MNLLIDIGNNRMKWGTGEGESVQGPFVLDASGADPEVAFAQAWGALRPATVAFCTVSVSPAADALRDWARRHWGLEPCEIRSSAAAGPLISGYSDPRALGADRWANLLGARSLLGESNAVVVDAGTAVTVDALEAGGRHLGGAILPGLQAARAGLRSAAPALPAAGEPVGLPARATRAAIAGGSLIGLAGAIERVAMEVGRSLPAPVWLLTGGDADTLRPWLDPSWRHDPQLTLRGLNAAVENPNAAHSS